MSARAVPVNVARPTAQHGFALLEVLIAVLVMAFGMLGIAGLLFASNRSNTSSIIKQQAVQSANDIVDRIRGNRGAAINNGYNANNLTVSAAPVLPSPPSPDCSASSPCTTPAQQAAFDIWQWLTQLSTQLPIGSGSIVTTTDPGTGNTKLTVTVQWDDTPAEKNFGAAASSASPSSLGIANIVIETVL